MIDQIARSRSLEELMILFQRDLAKEFSIPHVYLLMPIKRVQKLFYLFKGQIQTSTINQKYSVSTTVGISDIEDRKFLANQIGKPFVNVLRLPLVAREGAPTSVFFFEHTLKAESIERVLEPLRERVQIFTIALERIRLERELRESALVWERTFDGLDDPICILDAGYNILRSNRSFARFKSSGLCYSAFAGSASVCVGCSAKELFRSMSPETGQVKRIEDGKEFVFDVSSYPIQLVEGISSTMVVNHYVDATHVRELKSRVIQNEKMAALGHLAGNIAHELNNPLTGIRSLAQILVKETEGDSELHSDICEVESASMRCQAIIKNLLEFSGDMSSSKRKVVDLSEIVARTLPLLKTAMSVFRSEIAFSKERLPVLVEPQLLQQVVFNLVNNACQAMSDRGTICVESRLMGNYCQLSVKDTGSGIESDVLENIFDPFFYH